MMKKMFIITLISIICASCDKYDMETTYFHVTNLELEFRLDPPDENGGCDCFIYLVNNYQMIIDNIVITYEIQNRKGEAIEDYKTGNSINKIRVKNVEPFYIGEDYWTVVPDMVYNTTAHYLKILDIEISFYK